MAFRLKDGVFLVEGTSRGAVLDTNSGLVYSVNDIACAIITYRLENDSYWGQLVAMGLAEEATTPVTSALPILGDTSSLQFVWFEVVTDNCNERCAHCYVESMPNAYRNNSGVVDDLHVQAAKQQKVKMKHQDWLKVMQEAYNLGCRACQLIGGEPFLYHGEGGETVLDLAEYLTGLGYTMVEIYTNATLLTPEKVDRIKTLGLHVAISLYSDQSDVHDAITKTPGSHAKTVRSIRWLKEAGIPTRVETVLMRTNQHTIDTTLKFRDSLGVDGRNPDPLRPKGRGDNPLLLPDFEQLVRYGLMLKPNFSVTSASLAHYATGHSCLLGKVTITEYGDVLPCVFSRTNVVGNVLVAPNLSSVVHGPSLARIWRTTKDNVLICRGCEYRYVCFDCRPLSEGAAEGRADYLSAPYPRCTYNPTTGEWGQGLWRVDAEGQPYYDRQFAPVIQKVASTMTTFDSSEVSH